MMKLEKTVNHYMGEPGTLIDYYNYSIINFNVCFNALYTHTNMISGVWAPEKMLPKRQLRRKLSPFDIISSSGNIQHLTKRDPGSIYRLQLNSY